MRLARRSNPSDIAIAPVVASIPAVLMHRTCLRFRTVTGGSRVRIWCHDSIYRVPVVLPGAFALNAAHRSLTFRGAGTTWSYLQVLWTMTQASFPSAASSGILELPGSNILTTFPGLPGIILRMNSQMGLWSRHPANHSLRRRVMVRKMVSNTESKCLLASSADL